MPCDYKKPGNNAITCQFDVSEVRLIRMGHNSYCIFHLPDSADASYDISKSKFTTEQKEDFKVKILERHEATKARKDLFDMNGVVFPGGINFEKMDFPEVDFSHATFLGHVSFSGSEFNGDAKFQSAKFNEGARFSDIKCRGVANFQSAVFEKHSYFNHVDIKGEAQFTNANLGTANFKSAHFSKDAIFYMSNMKDAAFIDARFEEDADFSNALFDRSMRFSNAEFQGKVFFSLKNVPRDSRRNLPQAYFENAKFHDHVTFNNRTFSDSTDFRGATFYTAPLFHEATLHQDTNFEVTDFKDKKRDSARAYRTLKLAMENVRARREEAKFYALEQECLRNNKNIDFSVRFFSWLYDKTSAYGQSVSKPLVWLLALIITFPLIYTIVAGVCCNPLATFNMDIAKDSFELSIQQMVNPFYIWRQNPQLDWLGNHLILIKLFATLQSILSLAFVALFFLVLRWRFKRG